LQRMREPMRAETQKIAQSIEEQFVLLRRSL
jgi:hypothetical protein